MILDEVASVLIGVHHSALTRRLKMLGGTLHGRRAPADVNFLAVT